MPYLTPDDAPDEVSIRRVSIPDTAQWRAIVNGALLEMTYPHNWEQHGVITPDEAAERALTMYLAFQEEDASVMLGSMAQQDKESVDIEGGTIRDISVLTGHLTEYMMMDGEGFDMRASLTSYFTQGGSLDLRLARGSRAVPTAVLSGDQLGDIRFVGYHGAGFSTGVHLRAQATENWSATNKGAKLTFFTVPNGGTTIVGALVIHNDKSLEIEGDLNHDGAKAGFMGAAPVVRPVVSGSKASGAAWASLLAAMVALGLVTDSSTA